MGDIGSRQVRFDVLPTSEQVEAADAHRAARTPADPQRPVEHEHAAARAEPARS